MRPVAGILLAGGCGPAQPSVSLLEAIDQGDSEAVQAHMEFGTEPDETFIPPEYPFVGASALHLAILKDDEEIVNILLDNGASIDIKARESFRGTPLDAARADNPFVAVGQVEPFLENRAFIREYLAANGGKSGLE